MEHLCSIMFVNVSFLWYYYQHDIHCCYLLPPWSSVCPEYGRLEFDSDCTIPKAKKIVAPRLALFIMETNIVVFWTTKVVCINASYVVQRTLNHNNFVIRALNRCLEETFTSCPGVSHCQGLCLPGAWTISIFSFLEFHSGKHVKIIYGCFHPYQYSFIRLCQ